MILDLLLITIFVICLIDLTDINTSIKKYIAKIIHTKNYNSISVGLCSLCISWWSNLAYIIITGNISIINLLFAILFPVMSIQIKDIIVLIQDTITKIINLIYEKILQ